MTESRSGCRTAILIAAGLSFAVVAIGGLLVALNWSKLTAVYQKAAGTFTELTTVQRTVARQYGTSAVTVSAKRHTGVPGSILSIQLVNPPFLKDTPPDRLKGKALEIAILARSALQSPKGYDNYEVVIRRQAGVGLTVSTNRGFMFASDQLPPEPVAEP